MVRENINTERIDWLKQPEYRTVITKKELLKDIKSNIIRLLNDYKGRGINNEDMLIAEVNKMFTGGVVPSLVDWKIINIVLYELSEIKENGVMYNHFIKDVSDSLGVTDLIKIRNFVEYIASIPPIAPEVNVEIESFPKYNVENVTASFLHNINQPNEDNKATINWQVKKPDSVPYLRIVVRDSKSEDIERYEAIITAGKFKEIHKLDGIEMGQSKEKRISIPIRHQEWFSGQTSNLSFYVEVVAIDRRGNKNSFKETFIYAPSRGIPQGFSRFEVQYRPTESKKWQSTFGYSGNPNLGSASRSHGPVGLVDVDGNHRFRVRGYDSGAGWSEWVESPDYNLTFRGDPPGRPAPIATERTISRIDFSWKPTANTDYYTVYIKGPGRDVDRTWRIETSSSPASYFSGLQENSGFNIYVRAHNQWYPNGILGDVWIRTKKRTNKKTTYSGLRYATYNEQSYRPDDTPGYYRPKGKSTNEAGVDKPHWKSNSGSLYQGHWRETDWKSGRADEWYYAWRSSYAYQASDGQSHGNNSTMIEIDYNKIRTDLKDATINSVSVAIKREDSVHGHLEAKPIYLYTHNEDWEKWNWLNIYDWNRGKISYNNNPSTDSSKFERGGFAYIDNSKTRKMVENIRNGHMKGFAFIKYYSAYFHKPVHKGAIDYMRLDPKLFSITVNYTVDE